MSNKTPDLSIPGVPGDPYCGNCKYSLKGLEDSTKCPECGKPIVEVLMRKEFTLRGGRRYRSQATLCGLPVIDIALGFSGNEKRGKAHGIIAIGDIAIGWIAIGGIARGIVAVGGLAVGVFAFGGLSIGLISAVGGLVVSSGIAFGGDAIGTIASGGVAVGIFAQGALAIGIFVHGVAAHGITSSGGFARLRWLIGGFTPHGSGFFGIFRPLLFALPLSILTTILIGIPSIIRLKRSGELGGKKSVTAD